MKKYGNMYRLLIEVESEIKVFIGKNPKYKIFGI